MTTQAGFRRGRTLLRCVAFFALLAALLGVLSWLFAPKDNGTKEMGREDNARANGIFAEGANTVDVVIIGDSETYSAISPLEMWESQGLTAYVCGTSAQPISESLRFLKTVFEHQSPRLVILETNTLYRDITFDTALLSEMEALFPVFQYHDRWKTLSADDLGPVEYTHADRFKGFLYTTKTVPAQPDDYMKDSPRERKINQWNRMCLSGIAGLCQEQGAQLLLLSTPSCKNWTREKHNGVQRYAQQHELAYLDMNLLKEEIAIDWSADTRDKGDHLNYAGAVKVSRYLGERLAADYSLPDHRGDPAYASWDEALDEYRQKTAA